MAKRAWAVRPDHIVDTIGPDGQPGAQLPAVSKQAFLEAVIDAAVMVHRAGGVLSALVFRQPTGVPHEMVTVGGIVEWKDRTDARAQPEEAAAAPAAPAPAPAIEIEEQDAAGVDVDAELARIEAQAAGDAGEVDEEAVDESSLPPALRGA